MNEIYELDRRIKEALSPAYTRIMGIWRKWYIRYPARIVIIMATSYLMLLCVLMIVSGNVVYTTQGVARIISILILSTALNYLAITSKWGAIK
jgi:hypothetical protein